MNDKNNVHTFHIPVMGIGFSIDTPIKVAQYGISSVISIVDDILIEKIREFYCKKLNISFEAISNKIEDYRACRITAYLNLVEKIVKDKFEMLKNSVLQKGSELEKYIDMLPDVSILKQKFNNILENSDNVKEARDWIKNNMSIGSIDVNIMTKIDKENYYKNEKLPPEYNDAHSALRGFANSTLKSSVVFSAGMNPRLYSYLANFDDFYPDENGQLNKKIILKVSDYRSALIQGKFFAKKGLWVSEFRIESGLNCGGHAFPTDGNLMGPILEEFKNNRDDLIQTLYEILLQSLKDKKRTIPATPLKVKITAQGGVGTAQEHQFLLDHYQMDSIGWATPFLLVPEVTNVDFYTRKLLSKAKEDDLYLSYISPLNVPFNSIKGNTKDITKIQAIDDGRPGSPCPNKFLVSNKEFTDKAICTASRQYQSKKIKELDTENLSPENYKFKFDKIVDKSCICAGLGTSSLLVNDLDTKIVGAGVSICPGPNLAYFSDIVTLKMMVDHIYGKINIMKRKDRPSMFVKEMAVYIDYFKNNINEVKKPIEDRQWKYLNTFQSNINDGIKYYKDLFLNIKTNLDGIKSNILENFEKLEEELNNINLEKIFDYKIKILSQ